MRNVLVQFGEGIEDGAEKAAFQSVVAGHQFSSDRSDAVTYQGPFIRALEEAGLENIQAELIERYYGVFAEMDRKN